MTTRWQAWRGSKVRVRYYATLLVAGIAMYCDVRLLGHEGRAFFYQTLYRGFIFGALIAEVLAYVSHRRAMRHIPTEDDS